MYGYGYGYGYMGIGLVFYVTLLVFWPNSSAFLTPFIFVSRMIGVVYASITTNQQVDLNNIIAYSLANVGRYPELVVL